jgi:hypothetical protein
LVLLVLLPFVVLALVLAPVTFVPVPLVMARVDFMPVDGRSADLTSGLTMFCSAGANREGAAARRSRMALEPECAAKILASSVLLIHGQCRT